MQTKNDKFLTRLAECVINLGATWDGRTFTVIDAAIVWPTIDSSKADLKKARNRFMKQMYSYFFFKKSENIYINLFKFHDLLRIPRYDSIEAQLGFIDDIGDTSFIPTKFASQILFEQKILMKRNEIEKAMFDQHTQLQKKIINCRQQFELISEDFIDVRTRIKQRKIFEKKLNDNHNNINSCLKELRQNYEKAMLKMQVDGIWPIIENTGFCTDRWL